MENKKRHQKQTTSCKKSLKSIKVYTDMIKVNYNQEHTSKKKII